MDFRPRSWIVVALLALLAALPTVAFAVIVALLFHEEAERKDGTAFGVAQLLVAGTGLVLAAVAAVESAPALPPAMALARGGRGRVRRLGRPAAQRDPLTPGGQVSVYSGPEPPSGGVNRPPFAVMAPHWTQFDGVTLTETIPSPRSAPTS